MPRKVIVFEMNEVPWQIVDDFCRRYPDSTLARVLPRSAQYETITDPVEGILQPWKIWPSIYRGVSHKQHQISHLGQCHAEADAAYPPVWDLLSRAGVSCGIFGSIHTYPLPENAADYAFYVPDTFASDPTCHPAEVTKVQAFNLKMTADSGRSVSTKIHWGSALPVVMRAPQLGIRLRTIMKILVQLVDERIHPWHRVRRRSIQAALVFDIFMHQMKRTRPGFSTFFTNNAASALHRFWASLFPDEYPDLELGQEWIDRYAEEVPFAMETMDGFLSELVAFVDADPSYQLVVASGMGMGPTATAPVSRKLYLRDLESFTSAMGLAPEDYTQRPAMEPAVNIVVTPSKVDSFRAALETLSIEGKPAYFVERSGGFFNLVFGQPDLDDAAPIAKLGDRAIRPRDMGLFGVPVEDGADGTGFHIPNGVFFIYDPQKPTSSMERPQVSTLELAPSLLRALGIEPPDYMQDGRAFPELAGEGDEA